MFFEELFSIDEEDGIIELRLLVVDEEASPPLLVRVLFRLGLL